MNSFFYAFKQRIKKHRGIYFLIQLILMIWHSRWGKITGKQKKFPHTIQLPITNKCNSRCVMCNIWQTDNTKEADISEFSSFFKDSIFKEVTSVGVNGGEPALVKDLPEYIEPILKLPKIKALNVISNGFIKTPFLENIKKIFQMCRSKNISFHLSISLDGVGQVHDKVRNIPNAFKKTLATIEEIQNNKSLYCDTFNIGCTIVKQNIDNIVELDAFAQSKNIEVEYRLGVPNKRISSDKNLDQYAIKEKHHIQSAKEFFHYQMTKSKSIYDKFKYFSIIYSLENNSSKRLLGCTWKDEGITLDRNGNLYYCAVASDCIGNIRNNTGEEIFFDKKNIQYRKNLIKISCDTCIHDYTGRIELKSLYCFIKEFVLNQYAMRYYKELMKFKR